MEGRVRKTGPNLIYNIIKQTGTADEITHDTTAAYTKDVILSYAVLTKNIGKNVGRERNGSSVCRRTKLSTTMATSRTPAA